MCLKNSLAYHCKTSEMSDNTLIINDFRLNFYRTAADVRRNIPPQYFEHLEHSTNKNNDLFLNLDYLETVEQTPPM